MSTSATDIPKADPSVDAAGSAPVHVPHRVGGPRRWWDWVLASDPGLCQLQAGWRSLVCVSVGLTAGYKLSHSLGVPVFFGMLLAGLIGVFSSVMIAENTPLHLARAILWMPLPFCAILPLAVWLHPHRMLNMCLMGLMGVMIIVLARYGQIWMITGLVMFLACTFGLSTPLPLELWWRILCLSIACSAAILVARLVLCYPMPREELLRTQRAFLVEARRIAEAASLALARTPTGPWRSGACGARCGG